MRFEIAADTDRGIVKETNQDSLLVKCFSTCKGDMAFAVLCDGMGGLSKGELASATVVRAFDRWSDEQLPELCKSSTPDIDSLILERQWDEVIQQQNEKIKAYGKAHAVNMGTTVVVLLVTQKAYYIINVGDSRIYSLSDHIERLTTDQTYVQREIMNGNMTQEQAMRDPRRNVLLQCVGASAREYKENNIEDTTCLGTMGYAAPEQFGGMGQTDARTDIYCLGATMYHLVTGMNPCEPPYEIRPIREIDPTLSGGLERIITKCTQPDPNNRYQSAAELMYDLEHYTEIDDMYRKNLKRKLAVFITTSVLTMLLGTSTVLSYCAAEHKKNENYNSILKEADTYDNYDNGYYTAIVTDPTRTEAYLKLNDKLTDDFVLDRDEAQILNRLMVGIDCKDHNGRVHTYDVMAKLKEKNPKGYEDVCYKIGESFLFYYEINVEKDRYSSAAQWFKEAKENHPEAGIYCEISDCLTLISQYDGAKIQQTEKTYEEYKKLWKQINELYAKSEDFDSLDAKIQVWNEIDDIVDTNITSFIAVTDKDKVMDLLQTIKDKTEKLDKSIMREQITGLQDNIDKTIEKAQSVKEENKDDL